MSGNSVQERFDALQVVAMAMRLSVKEIEALGESTELREAGLKASRIGDLQDARQLILEARENRNRVALSQEAETVFETYQLAAESYLHYREGDFEKAEAEMMAAIATANELKHNYDYVVGLRRIHLAANIVRINLKKSSPVHNLTTGIKLMRYILGEVTQWPWPSLKLENVETLTSEEKILILSQLLPSLSTACHNLQAHEIQLIREKLAEFNEAINAAAFAGPKIQEWIEDCRQELHRRSLDTAYEPMYPRRINNQT